jgi:hypothetical protein
MERSLPVIRRELNCLSVTDIAEGGTAMEQSYALSPIADTNQIRPVLV